MNAREYRTLRLLWESWPSDDAHNLLDPQDILVTVAEELQATCDQLYPDRKQQQLWTKQP